MQTGQVTSAVVLQQQQPSALQQLQQLPLGLPGHVPFARQSLLQEQLGHSQHLDIFPTSALQRQLAKVGGGGGMGMPCDSSNLVLEHVL